MLLNNVICLVLALIAMKLFAEVLLERLNAQHVRAHQGAIPEAFARFMDASLYAKSASYTLAKGRFNQVQLAWGALVLAAVLSFNVLPVLFYWLFTHLGSGLWAQACMFFLMSIVLGLPSLPLEWWNQFKLEGAFGFNNTTLGLWIGDRLKGLILMSLFGVPLIYVILLIIDVSPESWWIWGALALFSFQILMLIAYPLVIIPLFNKLSPLEEGALKDDLLEMAQNADFKASAILVMDGSKRSKHSNAFFTGFGRFRKIILFDTLIEQLSSEEIKAVLAHEIGHCKKGHILQRFVLNAAFLFIGFYALGYLSSAHWFYTAFGFSYPSGMVPVLLLFSMLSGLFTFWLSPVMNLWSRKHEYEADTYAKGIMGNEDALVSALRKLTEKNLSNLTPHPVYSFFHYSHPSLIEREQALKT